MAEINNWFEDEQDNKKTLESWSNSIVFSSPAIRYEIDYDKVNSIEDIKKVLMGLNISVYDNYNNFDALKSLLKKSEGY